MENPLPLTANPTALTVHHLHISQSERVPWFCEELSIPYILKTYDRAPLLAPQELKDLHPTQSAPVITDGSITLSESNACIEFIAHKYGNGRLFVKPSEANYADFLFWWHWANGSLQANMVRAAALRAAGLPEDNKGRQNATVRVKRHLGLLDKQVGKGGWIVGEEFTAADVMAVFSLTTMRYFYPIDLDEFTGILGYLERVSKREAYQKTMKKIDPDMKLVLGAKAPEKSLM